MKSWISSKEKETRRNGHTAYSLIFWKKKEGGREKLMISKHTVLLNSNKELVTVFTKKLLFKIWHSLLLDSKCNSSLPTSTQIQIQRNSFSWFLHLCWICIVLFHTDVSIFMRGIFRKNRNRKSSAIMLILLHGGWGENYRPENRTRIIKK